ncbi:MAG: RNAase [Lachnospiraceae bacterium]|nr:RNAase [Lachnospiraceae bacterium]
MEKSLKDLLRSLKNINFDEKLDDPQNEQVLKLAFVGDTIFDLFTRDLLNRKFVDKIKINELHKKNSELVCAKSQSKISDFLVNEVLDEEEISFFKHARNAHSHSKSKNSSIVEYRKATGLEALLGLLFYKDEKRLIELLDKIAEQIDK